MLFFPITQPFIKSSRFISKRIQNVKNRDSVVIDMGCGSSQRKVNLYGFGFAATGALGVRDFILPRGNRAGRENVSLPHRNTYFLDNNLRIIHMACGFGFSSFVCRKGRKNIVYGFGLNSDGQIGIQRSGVRAEMHDGQMLEVIPEPALVDISMLNPDPEKYFIKPTSTACGRAHMLISADLVDKEDHQTAEYIVISTGNNVFGQGGRQIIEGEVFSADHAVISRTHLPESISGIKKVVCGQDHSLVLSTNGKLFACGLGSDGQTGLETYKNVDTFTRIRGPLAHLKVDKADTSLALTSCNRLFSWGNNEYGQIWDHPELMQINVPHELHLTPDTVIVPPEAGIRSKDLLKIGKIVSIACAGSMNAVVDSFGQVFVWGFGNLGLGPKVEFTQRPTLIPPGLFAPASAHSADKTFVTNVFSGLHHFVALSKKLGLMWAWGASRSGISCLGLGKGAEFKLQGLHFSEAQSYPRQVYIPGQVTDAACGVDHTFVLAKDPA